MLPLQQPLQFELLHEAVTATQVPWLHWVPDPHATVSGAYEQFPVSGEQVPGTAQVFTVCPS